MSDFPHAHDRPPSDRARAKSRRRWLMLGTGVAAAGVLFGLLSAAVDHVREAAARSQ